MKFTKKRDTSGENLPEIGYSGNSKAVNLLCGFTLNIISVNKPVCQVFPLVVGTQQVRMCFVFLRKKNKDLQKDPLLVLRLWQHQQVSKITPIVRLSTISIHFQDANLLRQVAFQKCFNGLALKSGEF